MMKSPTYTADCVYNHRMVFEPSGIFEPNYTRHYFGFIPQLANKMIESISMCGVGAGFSRTTADEPSLITLADETGFHFVERLPIVFIDNPAVYSKEPFCFRPRVINWEKSFVEKIDIDEVQDFEYNFLIFYHEI